MDSNIAFSIFGLDIYWYSLMIMTGVVLGFFISTKLTRKRGYNSELVMDVLLLGIPLGIIGARLYFVAFSWDMFKNNLDQIFTLQMEGLAIYGGVIGGVLAVLILSKWKKFSFWDVTDAAVPSLILAQAIGRWGNFFNQEIYGAAITGGIGGQVGSHLALFPPAVFIDATQSWHVALFFYESMLNFIIFGILLTFYLKKPGYRGCTTWLYFALYCFIRAILEGMRLPEYILFFLGIPVSQLVSGVMCVIAFGFFIHAYRKGGYDAKEIPESYSLKTAAEASAEE